MKGYRFYQVVENKGKASEERKEECVAIMTNTMRIGWCGDHYDALYQGAGAVFYYPNSPCASSEIAQRYLIHTRRVSEAVARKAHPALFEYLEGS
jgi:hypothetical protein